MATFVNTAGNIDDLMVCLMSMGFDYGDCQEAVQNGHLTVERAVEWLLAGKPGSSQAAQNQPTLNLRAQQPEHTNLAQDSNPFVSPIKLDASEPAATSSQPTSVKENTSQSSDRIGEEDQSESSVLSRLHLSDEQRKVKENFHLKQREEARQSALKEKQRRKRDHERILKEIAEDREKKKITTTHQATASSTTQNASPDKSPNSTPSPNKAEKKEKDTKCLIQIRMLDGSVARKQLSPDARFQEVWELVKFQRQNTGDIKLIQPFPHKEFGLHQCALTLDELGLTPSASLMVKRADATQAVSIESKGSSYSSKESSSQAAVPPAANNQNPPGGGSMAGIHQGLGPPDLDLPGNHGINPIQNLPGNILGGLGLQPPAPPQHNQAWGPGHRMDEDDADEESDDEEEGDPDQGPDLALMGLPLPQGLGNHGANADSFWGVGQRLVPEGHPQAQDAHHHIPAARLAAEKARERYAHPVVIEVPIENPESSHHATLTYNVSSLMHLCLHHVARRLSLNDPQHPLVSLSGVTEELAQKILLYLLKEKLLKPKTLNAFVPCYLRKLVLDCYPYTTNELLQSVRYHLRLQHLSLRSCPLITDAGLQPLSVLQNVKIINLSGCKQLTNKCLPVIAELKSLSSLNLEETGITETGLISFLSICSQSLQCLNLNRTSVTENIIHNLAALPNLKSLYLEQTQVCGLSGIEHLGKLETLDVAHTEIVTDSLLCLGPSITCLGISNTNKVHGDTALKYVGGLKLQAINLPSRHTTTDEGMKYLSGMPITVLDLTNYINIGDEGMKHISGITTLKKLLLSNTKVTDEGMLYLEGLKSLETLYLDKTLVTDEGASVISSFTGLSELSLASTRVTSKFLQDGTLTNCFYLSKLNLSRTGVCDKGVLSVTSDSLTLLNLDGTYVKPSLVTQLYTSCPNLRNVTLTNLKSGGRDSEED